MTNRRNKLRRKPASSSNHNGNGTHATDQDAKRTCSNAVLFEYDKCHNAGSPCCNALRDIVASLFPDVISPTCDEEHEKNVAGSIHSAASEDKSEKPSIPSPSLFSLVVRKHLVEDRKNRLGGDLSRICSSSSNVLNSGARLAASGNESNADATISTATAACKKKRKKKKKKKSPHDQSGHQQGQTLSASISASHSPTPISSPTPPISAQSSADQSLPSLSTAHSTISSIHTQIQTHSSENKTQVKTETKLDAMLDRLLIQGHQNKKHGIILPQNRDLTSLFEYISKKCQPKSPSTSQSSSSASKKTKVSKNNNKTNSSSGIGSIQTPIIPQQEITEMIKKITCQDCQISCMKYLEFMSYDSGSSSSPNHYRSPNINGGISSALEVGWGGYQIDNLRREDSTSITEPTPGTTSRNGRDNSDEMVVLSSIQLDGKSVAIQRDPSRSRVVSPKMKRDEHAFDYDLMEEGGGCSDSLSISASNSNEVSSASQTISRAKSSTSSGLRMDLVQEKGTLLKYFRLNLGLEDDVTLTLDNFDSLIKDIIIPCGMKEQVAMTEEDIRQVTMNTEHLSDFLFDEVKCGLPQTLSDSQKALDDAEEYLKSPGAFNVKAVNSLRNCCELQVAYMERCKEFLSKLESRTLQMQASKHQHQKWVCSLMNKLWGLYMDCSRSLVEPSLRCMWEAIQLDCKRTGAVPQYFNSPPQRENLKSMLEKRLLILTKLQDKIELELLSSPKNDDGNGYSSTPVLRRLATFGEYFSLKEANTSSTLNQFRVEIDEMITLRNELVCSTINQRDVSTILQIQSDRCTRLRNKTNHVCKLLNDHLKSMDMAQKDLFTWQANMIMLEENMMIYEDRCEAEAEPSLDRDLNDVLNLCEFVKNTLNQFRFYSVIESESAMENPDDEEQIPPQVLKICERAYAGLKCEGGCGLRRVTGILSAYLYFWLNERCMEWHADLTHQELMIETENELLLESKENAAKEQKKKSKKKKKRKGSSKDNANVQENEQLDASLRSAEADEEKMQVSPTAIESFPLSDPLEDCLKESSTSQSETLVKNDSAKDSQSLSKIVKGDSSTDLSLDETKEEEVSSNEETIENEYVEVCVTDKGEKISAEFFLCSRYFQIFEDQNIVKI